MIFKILVSSSEVRNFHREITIDADATFLDLSKAILKSCDYEDDQVTYFFVGDERNGYSAQILMEEPDNNNPDTDIYLMQDTTMRDHIEDRGDRIDFIFDPFSERRFNLRVTDMTSGSVKQATCTQSIGKAPHQLMILDPDTPTAAGTSQDMGIMDDDETFFGSDGFNDDEFDADAFEIED